MKNFSLGFATASTLFLATLVLYVGFCPKSPFKARQTQLQTVPQKQEQPIVIMNIIPIPNQEPIDFVPSKPAPELKSLNPSQPNFEGLYPTPKIEPAK